MKYCSKCGAANGDESQFCCKCGAPLASGYDNGQPQYQTRYQHRSTSRSMGFVDAVRVCMQEKYASFSGRATRAEYWYFVLFMVIVLFCGALAGIFLGFALSGGDEDVALGIFLIVYGLLALGFICPGISVFVRRLHDTGRSGWWYWLCIIPYIGSIVLLIFALMPSEEIDNEYGPYVCY